MVAGCSLIKITDPPPTGLEDEKDYGPPLTEIRFEGLGYTKESIVRRQMASKVGQAYTEELARQDWKNLDRLGIFSSIHFDVEPDDNRENEGIVLTVTVTEINPYTPSVKIGITDENGLSFGLGASSANLFGRALKANASFNVGGEEGVKFGIRSPWYPGRRPQYKVDFSWQIRDNNLDDFRENAITLESLIQTNVSGNGRLGAFFLYYSIGSDTDGVTLDPDNRDEVPLLGAFVGLDSRNSAENPTSGWLVYVDGGRVLWGSANYWRGNIDVRAFYSPWNRHTLAFFTFTTWTTGVIGVDIPIWDDFHIGGTNSVRGWTFDARVGQNQSLSTIEYRYILLPPELVQISFLKMDMGLELAAFWDGGTAWYQDRPVADQIIGGLGLGIRLLLPSVSMLRFDFGVGESGAAITLRIGSNSKAVAQRQRVR